MNGHLAFNPGIAHQDPIAPVIFGVTMILIAALVGRHWARKLGQPSVLPLVPG